MAVIAPSAKQSFPYAPNGKLFYYAANTLTPLATYADAAGTVPNQHPITLDDRGEAIVYLQAGRVYDQALYSSSLVFLWMREDISGLAGDASTVNVSLNGLNNRTLSDKLSEFKSVKDYAAKGDASDDTDAFANATAPGLPVYVPATASYYAVTALTGAQRALLWGPGTVKLSGVTVVIPTAPQPLSTDLPASATIRAAWAPSQYPGVAGSIGNSASNDDITRTGGYGTYGSKLNRLHVTAAVPAGQFDVAATSWVTTTNLTGGQAFAGWLGANSPAAALGQTWSSGAVIGQEINVGNRWSDLGLQTDLGSKYTVGQQIVPDVLPAKDGTNDIAITGITVASPAVVTQTAHGYTAGMGVTLTGAGTVPTGLVKDTVYYVSATGLAANTYQLSATPGGSSINTTAGSFAAPISARPAWPGTFGQAFGGSVHGHRWWTCTLIRPNAIMPNGYREFANGGSIANQAPAAWAKLGGYWTRGLDMRSNAFSSYPIDLDGSSYPAFVNLDFTASVTTTATAGGFTLPANPAGFVYIAINGNLKKVAYYNT